VWGYSGDGTDAVVPATLGGQPVVSVTVFNLTSLDVSACTALKALTARGGSGSGSEYKLTSLNVESNIALEYLECRRNDLISLNVSKNTTLEILYCEQNELTSLDVSRNTALTDLYCAENKLTTLDVSKSSALVWLDCNKNRLISIDVSKNIKLQELICKSNRLTLLDVSKNTDLIVLECDDNRLTSLDVSKNTQLDENGLTLHHNYIPDSEARRALIERFGEAAVLPQYDIIPFTMPNGDAYIKGSGKDMILHIEKPLAEFDAETGVTINDVKLTSDQHTVTEGSTVVTVKSAYIDLLAEGSYNIEVPFIDGSVVVQTFTVAKEAGTTPTAITATQSSSPKTGDKTPLLALAALLLISVAGCSALYVRRRRLLKETR
jgi:LPXTG-motif cell wall-anchored protein